MDIELIDRTWACLPKEFKEEVKEIYTNVVMRHPCGYTYKNDLLKYLFGYHNLTSDAEGEEMLMCEKSKIQKVYNTSREIVKAENPDSLMYSMHTQIMCILENIFDSKCLPDAHEDNFVTKKPQPAEPKFKIGDKVRVKFNAKELHSNPDPSKNIYYWQTTRDKYLGKVFKITDIWKSGTITLNTAEVMFWEPFDLEPYTEPKDDKHFDNILKDGFHDHDRLHIAAMAMQGILSNADRMKGYEHIATAPPCEELTVVVARNALRYADELIRQSGKGDSKRTTTSHSARVENALGKANAAATAPTKTRTKDYTFQCADLQTQTNAPSFGGRKEKKNE